MDKIVGEQSKTTNISHANKLPAEIVGRFLQNLSVGDRLKSDRVSPRWKWALQKWGWTEQRKLNRKIVFEGATEESITRFWATSDDEGDCQLISLFRIVGQNLRELYLESFGRETLEPSIAKVAESLQMLPKLEKLNILGFNLGESMRPTPMLETLREISTSGPFNEATLSVLAAKCPNLEIVAFLDQDECGRTVHETSVNSMNNFLLKYPRLKKLYLCCEFPEGSGTLTSIGALKELEEFSFDSDCQVPLDDGVFEAMIENCKRLRLLGIHRKFPISEQSLCKLAELPDLVELSLPWHQPNVTDQVVKAISNGSKNLKKLKLTLCKEITDESIVYLVEHCKSLVTLVVDDCPKITNRSLEAVIAEVNRRHGNPPRTLPEGPTDKDIFYFYFSPRENVTVVDNPWLQTNFSRELHSRHFHPPVIYF